MFLMELHLRELSFTVIFDKTYMQSQSTHNVLSKNCIMITNNDVDSDLTSFGKKFSVAMKIDVITQTSQFSLMSYLLHQITY